MKKYLSHLFLLLLLTGCASSNNNKPVNPEEGNGEQEPVNPTPSADTLKKTITFYDGTFIGQLDQEGARSKFVNYVNGEDNLLSSIAFEGKSEAKEMEIAVLNDKSITTEKHVYWWLGSSSATGTIMMNFSIDITSIKLNVQAYHKPYQSSGNIIYNIDAESKFYIDDSSKPFDLSNDGNSIPDRKDIKVDYTTPTKSITIGTYEVKQRVFIHSMEITYKK